MTTTTTPPAEFHTALVEWLRSGTDHDFWDSDDPVHSRCGRLYTQSQWQDRGEPYGNTAAGGTLITEGDLCAGLNYGFPRDGDWQLMEEFQTFLAGHGYWYELGFHWSLHFYPLDDSADLGQGESTTAQQLSPGDTAIRHLWLDCRSIIDLNDDFPLHPELFTALQKSLLEIQDHFPHCDPE